MQYVLGNMLNGGGINPDGLSLDLQFAADKTLTARRGPTPVFTRLSGDNGGTTYFGPLVDFDLLYEIPSIGITNGRASWFKSDGGIDITISYTGTRWRAVVADNGNTDEYLAATGGEWRPDQADWSGVEFSVTTSSTFGIVKAANNEPRFDHNTTSPFACRGLLIEEGRTNALQHSANFKNTTSSSYWENITGTTVTVDQTTSPDGGVNADLLSTSATAFDCFFRRANIWAASTQYTYSVFLKQGPSNHRYVGLYIGVGVSALKFPFFDFNNPTVVQIPSGTMVGTINSTRVDAYPNGWYRVIVTFTTAATPVTTNCGAYISTSDGTLPSSSAAGLDAYVWGIQSELGSFATSYIPTTTGTLARGADVCSIANTASFWNSSEFTVFTNANFVTSGIDTYASNFNITSGFFGVRRNSSNVASAIIRSSGVNADINLGAFATGSMRMAVAHSTGQQAASLNGASAIQNNTAFVPSLNPLLNIGAGGVGVYLNGHVIAIRYYRKRLPNAKLVALTT